MATEARPSALRSASAPRRPLKSRVAPRSRTTSTAAASSARPHTPPGDVESDPPSRHAGGTTGTGVLSRAGSPIATRRSEAMSPADG